MPASLCAWYSSRDIESLAARKALLSGEIRLERLRRLSPYLQVNEGAVVARIRFEAHGSAWLALELEYTATLRMVCQRCLGPVDVDLQDRIDFGVLEAESLARYLPTGIEPLVPGSERLCPMDLIEDELIVSLPLVPKHADETECSGLSRLPELHASDDNR